MSRSLKPPNGLPSRICLAKGDISAMRENSTSKSGRIKFTPVTFVGIVIGFSLGNTGVANAASLPGLRQERLDSELLFTVASSAKDSCVGWADKCIAGSLPRKDLVDGAAVRK